MKRKPLFYVLLSLFLLLLTSVFLYTSPVLLSINPFYTQETNGEEGVKIFVRKDLISQAKAELPEGWKIKTESYYGRFNSVADESEEIRGLARIDILNNEKLISSIYAITDYGALITSFKAFPDSSPEYLQEMEGKGYEKIEIKEGEYSDISLFGTKARCINGVLMINENTEDSNYFVNEESYLLSFSKQGPSYKVYINGELNKEYEAKYIQVIEEGSTAEELKTLSTIFNSMELL
ncbi:MAG: hypothetical protein ACOX0X_01795 [Candidatus Dojkabacteria bacterium]